MNYDAREHRGKPEPFFYLMRLDAGLLKRLANVRRRETGDGVRIDDYAIQRRHDQDRSDEIADYVQVGFPWADVKGRKRKSEEFRDLRKPGWLPTALVVNILGPHDRRGGDTVAPGDLIRIVPGDSDGYVSVELPNRSADTSWRPLRVPPIEVIDGQHRLWAFTEQGIPESFELPVVAFHALDISWQAYLFYTINIKPKKINRSLAFDLYPLLRVEEWLEKTEGAAIYRETRAQELTEILWSAPQSPWKGRINMLGDPAKGGVSQAAWIRSLMSSFVKGWDGRGRRIGGLFGAPIGADRMALPWSRAQQGAFMIMLWEALKASIAREKPEWVRNLGASESTAMFAQYSLINTDQGVRAILQVFNDFVYLQARALKLFSWRTTEAISEQVSLPEVARALQSGVDQPFAANLSAIANGIATFDWRTSAAPGLTDDQVVERMALRGSGGYGELRRRLVRHLMAIDELKPVADRIAEAIRA